MKAKRRTAAQVAEDCLVYDKPVMLQQQIPETGAWTDVQHLHVNVNKAVSPQGFSAENERLRQRLLFRLRYYSELENVRNHLQDYRIVYNGLHYELTDYDDYNERRRVVKLTGELYELPVTVMLLIPQSVRVLGVLKKQYPETGAELACTWETVSSEEKTVNRIVSVSERAKLTFRCISQINADCRIRRADGTIWEIIGQPENTGLAGRWMTAIVQRVSGGA